jgi:two-component system cell cycle sensor histidine kinase/response regulator CckA
MNDRSQSDPESERPRRLLVVDDEAPILGIVRRILTPAGYEVVTAESASTALAIASTQRPFDALITDFAMPNMNGDELARRLRLASPDLKVLYLTGFTDQLFTDKGTLWKSEAFLEKPASPRALREAVSLLLFGGIHEPDRLGSSASD